MKKLFLLLFIISACGILKSVLAKAPQKFSFQAVVRSARGLFVANDLIYFKISFLKHANDGYAPCLSRNTIFYH